MAARRPSTMIRRFHLRRAPSTGRGRQLKIYPGDASGEAPPVPIPNTEVKLSSAEDTRGATPWENRSSPGYFISQPRRFCRRGSCYARVVDRVCPLLGLAGGSAARDRRRRRRAPMPRRGSPCPLDRQHAGAALPDRRDERCERYLAYRAHRRGDPRTLGPRRRPRHHPAGARAASRRGAASPGGRGRAPSRPRGPAGAAWRRWASVARWRRDRRARRPAGNLGAAASRLASATDLTRRRRRAPTPTPSPPPRRRRRRPRSRRPAPTPVPRPRPRRRRRAPPADLHGRRRATRWRRSRSASGRRSRRSRRQTGSRIRTRSSSARCW